MVIGINQPYYMPYIGLFERIKACDKFLITPFTPLNRTRAFHRRTRIIQNTPGAILAYVYLTQRLSRNSNMMLYSDINLDRDFWTTQKEHIKTVYSTYKKAPFFFLIEDLLSMMVDDKVSTLAEYNTQMIKYFAKILGLEKKIIEPLDKDSLKQIDLSISSNDVNKSTYTNLEICKLLNGKVHIAGQNGPLWLDEKAFNKAGIQVLYQRVNLKPYPQYSKGKNFVPGLSIIDLIVNQGFRAKEFIGKNSDFVTREELLSSVKLTGR